MSVTCNGRVIVQGAPATGDALVLTAPISFWGGVDPKTGTIINVRHPEYGANIASKVLFIPATIGSSSASTILLELVYCDRAPAAIVLHEPDAILLLGLIGAREIGCVVPPAVLLDRKHHSQFAGSHVDVAKNGAIEAV